MTKFEPDLKLFSDRQSPKCKYAPYVNNFDFGLTCDVIGDLEVNEIRLRSTLLAGLSNGAVVSDIGGALNKPRQSVVSWDIPQSGAGLRGKGNFSPSKIPLPFSNCVRIAWERTVNSPLSNLFLSSFSNNSPFRF